MHVCYRRITRPDLLSTVFKAVLTHPRYTHILALFLL